MAEENYAFIKDGEVVNVAVFDNPSEELLLIFKSEFDLDEILLATDQTAFGGTYDGVQFWKPQPYPSWIKNDIEWEAPVDYPADGKFYIWDESSQMWKEVV